MSGALGGHGGAMMGGWLQGLGLEKHPWARWFSLWAQWPVGVADTVGAVRVGSGCSGCSGRSGSRIEGFQCGRTRRSVCGGSLWGSANTPSWTTPTSFLGILAPWEYSGQQCQPPSTRHTEVFT